MRVAQQNSGTLDGGTSTNPAENPAQYVKSLAMLALLVATTGTLGAQTVVPVHEEPRHRLAYESPELRVLDIEIPPGDTTLFHRHDLPMAYVLISPALTNAQVLGQSWGSAATDTGPFPDIGSVFLDETYRAAPIEHRVTCVDDCPFRLIGVMNRGPGQAIRAGGALGTAGSTEAEGRWFRTAYYTLATQTTWEWEGHGRPVAIVQVSPGVVSIEPETASTGRLQAPGEFLVLHADAQVHLHNSGSSPVTLAIVEVR